MQNKLIAALIAVCVSLCLLIAGEWWYNAEAQEQLLSTTVAKPSNYQADELPSIALDEQSEDSYDDLANRPLFVKGRKPVNEPKPEDVKLTATNTGHFDWHLKGFYTKDKKLMALFARTRPGPPKDAYKKLSIGDELDGWKLTEIRQSNHGTKDDAKKMGVTLSQENGTTKLLLYRDAKAKMSAMVGGIPPPQQPPNGEAPPPEAPPVNAPEPIPEPELQTEPDETPAEDFDNSNAHF